VPGQPVWGGPRSGVDIRGDQAAIKCSIIKVRC
jgi:hypothetical protein